jgi:pimeloyl-ACP methyl ester carboxylesterase
MVSPEGWPTCCASACAIRTGWRRTCSPVSTAPFAGDAADGAREALARAALGLSLRTIREIGAALPTITAPVRVIHGVHDPFLPDIGRTVERLRADIPQADGDRARRLRALHPARGGGPGGPPAGRVPRRHRQ